MSVKDDGKQNSQSAKVLQLGFNISVSGDPGTDFKIVLDDTGQKAIPSTSQNDTCLPSGILPENLAKTETSKRELNVDTQEVESMYSQSVKLKNSKDTSLKKDKKSESPTGKELSIIKEIKSTLEHFEKFSDHLKDVPRLRGHPKATSTPLSDKNNSKSESNLIYSEYRPRRFSHFNDYYYRKNYYFNNPEKPPDVFLKPLPGESIYRSRFYSRYKTDSFRPYVSDTSLNKTSDYKAVCEKSKHDLTLDLQGILKKPSSESGDKQSTSSTESIKDIKIYQSGGILIMQNFKENIDALEKREISEFSAKLIENCSRLREEINSFQEGHARGMSFSSEEGRSHGKIVQFDLPEFERQKFKSGDSSFSSSKDEKLILKQGSSDSISDSTRNKDISPQGISQCQDFPSLSTVENESTISNQPGMSPTYSSTKKLEWDSGADVGYCNSDPSKENLSTIEKYVLSHLSSGTQIDNLIISDSERSVQPDFSKFAQVRIASDKLIDDVREERRKEQREIMIIEKREKEKTSSCNDVVEVSDDEPAKNTEVVTSKESVHSKPEKLKPLNEVSKQFKFKSKRIESTDKSVNVNTLFENVDLNPSHKTISSEDHRRIDICAKKSQKLRKLRKSKPSPRKITWASQKRRFSLESLNKNYGLPVFEMGIPKRTYKKVDGNPEIRDVELSREVEEIVIDQRFKIKQNVSSGKEIKKPNTAPDEKENKPKRPVSGSSSSNNTVLPNVENKESKNKEALDVNKFSDQIIQTVDLDCESVGVQAFESQKSSDYNSREGGRRSKASEKAGNVHLSSKNIQAFGLNASLPKELAHPKEINFPENQNTKSTQFFGGPINSLPNYHSSLITKAGEFCGRVPKVLNVRKTAQAEMIRLNEENKKNILANDSQKTNSKSSSSRNKENLFPKNSKKSHRSASQKSKEANSSERKNMEDSDLKSKKCSSVTEDPDYVHTSDEVSSKVLTSEILKEHGDSIDRNIIQEKYFQSQLIELNKRETISRSTSMDPQIEGGGAEKQCVTVGCQYSSCSRGTTSEEESKDQVPEDDFIEKLKQRNQKTETTDQYDSSQNIMEEELLCTSKSTNQEQITNGSLPSSTQTAHSWIPGVQNSGQDKRGVGRARSFEYLPGHIYESSGNLREDLPSGTEQNLITSGSSDSGSGKVSVNEDAKDSEGRNTLILENSTDNSREYDQLKILDENLTELNLIVSKLWEKEAAVKNLNHSLFLNLCHKNGSGDYIGHTDNLQTEVINRKNLEEHGKDSDGRACELKADAKKETKEISTTSQTEEKTSSDREKFYDRRKILEKRISEEKQNQIKWIENEIHHLNILRRLLEKNSFSHQRKKRHSPAPSDTLKTETEHSNGDLNKNYSGPVTPVYGCTVSLAGDMISPPAENLPTSEGRSSREQEEQVNATSCDPVLYGMSVSVRNVATDESNNVQRVVMLPVGVQISLKGSNWGGECSNSEGKRGKTAKTKLQSRSISSDGNSPPKENVPCRRERLPQSDAHTQFPSSRRDCLNLPSTSVQTDFSSVKCNRCQRQSCFCLSLSDRSSRSASRSSEKSERKESLKYSYGNKVVESKTGSSTDAEVSELESSQVSKLPAKVPVKSDSRCASTESFQKSKCTRKNECRKHVEREQSAPIKSDLKGIVCRNPCQSNATSVSDKSDDFPSCRCTKVHVEKFSTCSCHITKIIRAKCTAESGIDQHKKRVWKTTENQACQTDQVTIVTKDLLDAPKLSKTYRAQEVECVSEKKIAVEKKVGVLQKVLNDERLSMEKRQSCHEKLGIDESKKRKVGAVRMSPEVDVPVKEKALQAVGTVRTPRMGAVMIDEKARESPDVLVDTKGLRADKTCTCFEAFQKESAKDNGHIETFWEETGEENDCFEVLRKKPTENDNHPRYYFLKIEETEIDDSNESLEMKNSLEVITVKVPVKKAGKGKIYNPKCSKPYQTSQYSMNSRKGGSKNCSCCHACKGYSQKSVEYNASGEFRITQAEKPQSPVRLSATHPRQVTPWDDMRYQYKYNKYQPQEERSSFLRTECYYDRSTNSQDSAPKRDIQIEYDSHKKYRCNCKTNFYENKRKQGRQLRVKNKPCHDDDILLNYQERQGMPQDGRHYDVDYYNYDRKEYKTRSELLKEEEKKRKTHQLSLQEYLCKNRPDFYNTAERRRQIITEKARERVKKYDRRTECLMSLLHYCNESDRSGSAGGKRIFTTSEIRGQTMKRYKKLPEVTGKIADQKKKEEYRTNKLVADIYSKKLQIEALKGHINLSNSISVLATI